MFVCRIMEQLEKHQELAMAPNITTPFRSVRDAFRRLLPYHVYNTPQVCLSFFRLLYRTSSRYAQMLEVIIECCVEKRLSLLTSVGFVLVYVGTKCYQWRYAVTSGWSNFRLQTLRRQLSFYFI